MFKKSIVIRSAGEARDCLKNLDDFVQSTQLEPQAKSFLLDQLKTTLSHAERQLSSEAVKNFTSDRAFEGDGYKVVVRSQQGAGGIFSKLKRLIGLS
jgi:hypothetical protein